VRLFVALELDRGLRRALAQGGERVAILGPNVRRVDESRLHLTLRFLGETADERIPDVVEAVEEAVEGVAPFAIVIRGLGAFPKPHVVRVLWAGIEPSAPLATLARRVDEAIRDRGFPREPRGFTPHITLVRAQGRPGRAAGELDPEQPRFGEQEVDRVAVMESRPSPRGPTYVPLARVELPDSETGVGTDLRAGP
jgi:2'-5' RNA ligase